MKKIKCACICTKFHWNRSSTLGGVVWTNVPGTSTDQTDRWISGTNDRQHDSSIPPNFVARLLYLIDNSIGDYPKNITILYPSRHHISLIAFPPVRSSLFKPLSELFGGVLNDVKCITAEGLSTGLNKQCNALIVGTYEDLFTLSKTYFPHTLLSGLSTTTAINVWYTEFTWGCPVV